MTTLEVLDIRMLIMKTNLDGIVKVALYTDNIILFLNKETDLRYALGIFNDVIFVLILHEKTHLKILVCCSVVIMPLKLKTGLSDKILSGDSFYYRNCTTV